MKKAGLALLGVLLGFSGTFTAHAECSLGVEQPEACVKTSVGITVLCRNKSAQVIEWLDTNDPSGEWELTRPNGQRVVAYRSRYPVSPELVSLAPGQEVTMGLPLTRWFTLAEAGTYHLRYRLPGGSGSGPLESGAVTFTMVPCDAMTILGKCRELLVKPAPDGERIGGFEDEAAFPCLEEALSTGVAPLSAIVSTLARSNTEAGTIILVNHYSAGGAFDRLAVWESLHGIDTTGLSEGLREQVGAILKEQPVTVKP